MSNSSKGSAFELEVKKIFLEEGFLVEKVRNTIWQRGDLFGIADVIAKKAKVMVYCQCKVIGSGTNFSMNNEFKKLVEFAIKHGNVNEYYYLWVKYLRGHPKYDKGIPYYKVCDYKGMKVDEGYYGCGIKNYC